MISTELRRSAIYVGDGRVKQFGFPFKIFTSDQISVVALDESGADEVVDSSRYGVVLNPDQETEPGGVVEFYTAPSVGINFVILSAVPYLQPLGLLNQGAFSAEDLNGAWDRNCVLIQQLKEKIDRALLVPAAETKTPAQLINELLHAQNDATQFAEEARASAEVAKAVEERLTGQETSLATELAQVGEEQIAAIRKEGTTQKGVVIAEGDAQVERIKGEASQILWEEGVACQEETWTLSQAVPAGTELTIPNGLTYMVGRHHLRLSWNGLTLYPGENYSEVGDADTTGQKIVVHFPMEEGDVLNAWVASLGAGAVADAIATANAASDAVAELSQKVVYKSAEAAS